MSENRELGIVSSGDNSVTSFRSLFIKHGISGVSCDNSRIDDLCRKLNADLPTSYRAFLLTAGNGFAPLEGSHYALEDDLAAIQRSARKVMREKLPANAWVFLLHQGFVCLFFLLNNGDDPAVFECVDSGQPNQIANSFSQWLLTKANGRLP